MTIILLLLLVMLILIPIVVMIKNGRRYIYNFYFSDKKAHFIPFILSLIVLYWLISSIVFGLGFALGESGETTGLFIRALSIMNYILHFVSTLVGIVVTEVCKIKIPTAVDLILYFLVDAVIWALIIFLIIQKTVKKITEIQ